DVVATGDASEQIGRASKAGVDHASLGRHGSRLRGALKARDRVLGGGGVLAALRFDEVGRNAAEYAAGDDRLVNEGDTGDVCAKTGGERDRVIRRKILRVAARQVDDDVLDHGPRSRSQCRPLFAGLRTGRGPASRLLACRRAMALMRRGFYFFAPSAPNCLR